MRDIFTALWNYRYFIGSSIRNDLRSRFARSRLGALWMILQPLAQVVIYSLVLSRIMVAKLPGIDNRYAYVIYLMAGMIAWSLFAEVVTRALTIFVENGNLMKKMAFPRVCLPVIIGGSCLVNNLLLLATAIGLFALMGQPLSLMILWLPFLIAVNLAFALGLGLILGVLNVFVRDVAQVMTVVLQLMFWLTPIVYMPNIIPDRLRALLEFNPMVPIVTAFQSVILYGRTPDMTGLAIIAMVAMVLLIFSLTLFRRAAPEMVDVL